MYLGTLVNLLAVLIQAECDATAGHRYGDWSSLLVSHHHPLPQMINTTLNSHPFKVHTQYIVTYLTSCGETGCKMPRKLDRE